MIQNLDHLVLLLLLPLMNAHSYSSEQNKILHLSHTHYLFIQNHVELWCSCIKIFEEKFPKFMNNYALWRNDSLSASY